MAMAMPNFYFHERINVSFVPSYPFIINELNCHIMFGYLFLIPVHNVHFTFVKPNEYIIFYEITNAFDRNGMEEIDNRERKRLWSIVQFPFGH